MPRRPQGWWSERDRRWYARLGEVSPTTGKRRAVALLDEDGALLGPGDQAGVHAAIGRLLKARDSAERETVRPSVDTVCRSFVAWHKEQGSATRTIRDHHYWLGRFAAVELDGAAIGSREAAAIRPEDLWAADEQLGPGAHRNLYASVLACWRWASRPMKGRTPARMLATNTLDGLPRPPAGSRGDCVVPWPVIRRLLRLARGWARRRAGARIDRTRWTRRLKVLCLTLIAHTGCRPFEAAHLRWDEIRWDRGILSIDPDRDKARRPGRKPRKPRVIAVPHWLMRALAIVARSPASHPVWVFRPAHEVRDSGLSVPELGRCLAEDLVPAGLAADPPLPWPDGATLYAMRHSWQSIGLEAESAEGVASAAGNSPAVLLSTYHHPRERHIRQVAENVWKVRRGPG